MRDAAAADTINFNPSLSGQTITLTGGEISLNSELTIDATALAAGVTISGNNAGRIFNIGVIGNVTLVGLTLINGNTNHHGGAIITGGILKVNRCTLSGNSASIEGGGIFNAFGNQVTLVNSTFVRNTAREGGAVCCTDAALTATNCTFTENTADIGGGISNQKSSPTLNNCSFQGNSAHLGGGISNLLQSSPTLNNCSFQGNSAYDGGGIFNHQSSPTLTNCSFQGNFASNQGGGIFNQKSSPTLNNCSFQGNSAFFGGGIYSPDFGIATLNNCIIWRNNDSTGTGTAASSVSSLLLGSETYSHCLIQGYSKDNLDKGNPSQNNLAPTDPLFVLNVDPSSAPTTGGNLRLLAGSPAIDAGDNTKNSTTTDLAGNPRFSGNIDLGAYEMPAPVLRQVRIATDNANSNWAKPGNVVTLTFTANEPIQTPVVTMFGNTVSAINTGGNIWTASMTVHGGTTEGVNSFSISATDLDGNLAASVTATTDGTAVTVDKTQPILTAPGDKIVRVYGVSSAAVSFSAGTSDNLDPAPVLAANPPSGSLFPMGETTVNLSLTDAAGNASVGSFKVTVQLLSTGEDTDGDGLNDLAEFQMSTLGFNWQVSQPALVNTLMTNANTAGLFTSGQVQTLHVGTPLISQVSPGRFRLTLGVQKSTNLNNPFTDFSLTGPGTTTEFLDGKLKFEFPATDNAAFFRIKTE